MKRIFSILLAVLLLSSCSEYQRALKSEDIALKFEVATKKYEKGRYQKAIRLFEQIAPTYRGKPQAEKMFYMYGMAFYKEKEWYSAGYQFESFAANYPKSEKIEEVSFLGAKSYAKLSPRYSLDQGDTFKAIDKYQSFINNFPNSQYLPEANLAVKELREKIEKKNFEIAKQYNTIQDYKSAIVVLDNFVADFPGTPYKEDALYYRLDSAYKLAQNSVPSKLQERLNIAKVAYNNLIRFKPDTQYKAKADEMLARIETDLKQFSK